MIPVIQDLKNEQCCFIEWNEPYTSDLVGRMEDQVDLGTVSHLLYQGRQPLNFRGVPYYAANLIEQLVLLNNHDYGITFFDYNRERGNMELIQSHIAPDLFKKLRISECNNESYLSVINWAAESLEDTKLHQYSDFFEEKTDVLHFPHSTTIGCELPRHSVVTVDAYDDKNCFPEKNMNVLSKYHIDDPYVMYIGALDARKGLLDIVEAFGQIETKYKDVRLVLACGCPVITTSVSSFPEVGGDAAVYVEPNKPEQLAEEMMKLLDSKERRQQYSEKSLERCKLFSRKKVLETEKIYEITAEM